MYCFFGGLDPDPCFLGGLDLVPCFLGGLDLVPCIPIIIHSPGIIVLPLEVNIRAQSSR